MIWFSDSQQISMNTTHCHMAVLALGNVTLLSNMLSPKQQQLSGQLLWHHQAFLVELFVRPAIITTAASLCLHFQIPFGNCERHGVNSGFKSNSFLEQPLPTKSFLGSWNKHQLALKNGTAELLCPGTAVELQPDVNISFDVKESL